MDPAEIGSTKRKRERKPKVRTGCRTCKRRRVKCDEGLPSCLRCTKAAITCDGYGPPKDGYLLPAEQDYLSNQIVRLISFGHKCDNNQERRAFQFFCDKTALEISGFLPSDFWNRLIIQASHSDPAILHAAIALGTLHEASEESQAVCLNSDAGARHRFALKQIDKAICQLRTSLSSGAARSGEFVLLSCLVFICLETFRGNHEAALTHLESGLAILSSWIIEDVQTVYSEDKVSRPTRQFLEEELVPLFTRLDVQASIYHTSRSLWNLKTRSGGKKPAIPPSFTSLRDAHNHLADLVHWALYSNNSAHNMMYWMVENPMISANIPTPPSASQEPITQLPGVILKKIRKTEIETGQVLQEWLDALNIFLIARKGLTADELRGAVMLKILHIGTMVIQTPSLYNHDMEYDRYFPEFERLITLAESLINPQLATTSKTKLLYSFEMNILPPLHYCVTRCRDPKLRRRALKLLENSPRREGMWDSAMIAAIGRFVIKEEEVGLAEVSSADQIIASRRICILDHVPTLEEKTCLIRYCRGVRNPYTELDIQESFVKW